MLTPSEIAAIGAAMALSGAKAEDACVQALVSLATSGALDGASLADALGMSFQVPGLVIGTLRDTPIVSSRQLVSVVSDALDRSARRDAKALGITPEVLERALTPGHDAVSGTQAVVESLRAAFARDNLAMASDARDTWVGAVSEWVPKAARGEVAYETAVAGIAKECADRGVKAVDYKSGRRDSPDVAARRHVITQIQQAAASRTADAASKMGDGLVFVSSHIGARPSHREWQGRPYAMHGPKTIDGVTYPDLAEATGYGTPGGLCGANCRHSFGPWMHWQTRPYSPTPDEDAGLDPDEAYKATQKQRANERAIRKAKLEAQAAKAAGDDDAEARLRLGRAQRAQRDLMSQNRWLARRPERETAYGADGKAVSVRALTKVRKQSGGVSGALNETNDPGGKRRDKHARQFYNEMRHRDKEQVAIRIASNAGVDVETAERAFEHVFMDKHDLANGHTYFDPDYDMAQSWQRLASGEEVFEHDRVLVRHEAYEAELMRSGVDYSTAHDMTVDAGYDYESALAKWKGTAGNA